MISVTNGLLCGCHDKGDRRGWGVMCSRPGGGGCSEVSAGNEAGTNGRMAPVLFTSLLTASRTLYIKRHASHYDTMVTKLTLSDYNVYTNNLGWA